MHNVVWGCAEILPIFLLYDKTEFKHTQPNVSIKKKFWNIEKHPSYLEKRVSNESLEIRKVS